MPKAKCFTFKEPIEKTSEFRNAFLKTIEKIIKKPLVTKGIKEDPEVKKKPEPANPLERMREVVKVYKEQIIKNRKPIEER